MKMNLWIDLPLARAQHDQYTSLLRRLLPHVVEIEGDPNHPDCCFIEDTAFVIQDTVVISFLGAVERRGEQVAVEKFFAELIGKGTTHLKTLIKIESPGLIDGGDVFFTGYDIFIGLSKRTNMEAINQVKKIFESRFNVHAIPVTQGLHLKSVLSGLDPETILITASETGKAIEKEISSITGRYTFVHVEDMVAANVLRIGKTMVIQDGFPKLEKVLRGFAEKNGLQVEKLTMSELIKADGALTCCSILF